MMPQTPPIYYADAEIDAVHDFAWRNRDGAAGSGSVNGAKLLLDKIAPSIAARVLRGVAEDHRAARTSTQQSIWPAELDFIAGEIERGAL